MSETYDCRKCYKKTLEIVREHLATRCKDGESIVAEVYGSYGDDCYLSINYDTIIDKKHISECEHLPVGFLGRSYVMKSLPVILDLLLEQWRGMK